MPSAKFEAERIRYVLQKGFIIDFYSIGSRGTLLSPKAFLPCPAASFTKQHYRKMDASQSKRD